MSLCVIQILILYIGRENDKEVFNVFWVIFYMPIGEIGLFVTITPMPKS